MVKAYSYGNGDPTISRTLQDKGLVEHFGVAYTHEGIALREAGIHLPIMIMNPAKAEIDQIIEFDLSPTAYDLDFLLDFASYSNDSLPGIHLKIDSGMHRLGFQLDQLDEVLNVIKENEVVVTGMYTHLVATPEEKHDQFTIEQIAYFNKAYDQAIEALGYEPLKHVLNSAGAIRFKDHQYDMVRIGMGLYGLDPASLIQDELTPIASLTTRISQIHILQPGETVGYSRVGKITRPDQKIAVLPLGYADGYNRLLSDGNGEVFVNGRRAPVFGNICMDMMFIDISDIPASVGDEVELIGSHISYDEVAAKINSISYEVMTSFGSRLNRVYT